MAWILYAWSGLFGLVILAEFWLLANDLFHAREARRMFGVLGAGAILGGILGGVSSGWLARHIGAEGLLYVVAAELMAAAVAAHLAWSARPADGPVAEKTPTGASEGFALLRESGYVRLLAIIMVCMTVCITVAEWQYKAIAKAHFGSHQDELTRFFGLVAALVSAASFVFQIVGTTVLLKRYGTGCLRALPLTSALGALFLLGSLVLPIGMLLPAAAGVLLADGLRFSIDKSAVELLYTPLAVEVRERAKRFVDTVTDRFAGALAGILWLTLTAVVDIDRPERVPYASGLILVFAAIWLVAIGRARRAYVEACREVVGGAPLPDEDPRPARARARAERLLAVLHGNAAARTRALRAIGRIQRDTPGLGLDPATIEPFLAQETRLLATLRAALRTEAAATRGRSPLVKLLEDRTNRALERVARLLSLAYPPQDILAVHRALKAGSVHVRAVALELLEHLLEGGCKAELLSVLEDHALGTTDPLPGRADALLLLFALDDPRLRSCAAWTAANAGLLEPELQQMLRSDSSRVVRAALVMALRGFKRAPRTATALLK
jgi:hypothetical protein